MYGWISTIINELAKPRTKLIRTNLNAYYMLIRLMLPKVSEPLLIEFTVLIWINIHRINVFLYKIDVFVSDASGTVSIVSILLISILCPHFILKNHAKSNLDSNIVANLWVIEANYKSQ